MTYRNYSDRAVQTSIANGSGLTPSDTQLALGSTTGMPTVFPFELILNPDMSNVEVVLVTSGLGTIGTPYVITRGYGTSTAVSHAFTEKVVHGVSSADFKDSRDHEAATLNVHGGGHVNGMFNPLEYGAVGDGSTDDAAAIQATITAMPAEGGILYFPANKVFNFNATLDFTAKGNVIIRGHGGRSAGATVPTSRVRYTGGSGPGFNFQGLNSISIEDIQITYQSGSLSGTVLRFDGASTAALTNSISMYNVSCYGAGSSTTATWVSLDNVSHVNISNCEFVGAAVGIIGKSINGNISRSVLIEGCRFVNCDVSIKNPGRTWTVSNCSSNGGTSPAFTTANFINHDAGVTCNGLNIINNRCDSTVTSGTQFTLSGKSIRFTGNYVYASGGVGLNVDELSNGVIIEGNSFDTMTTAITFGAFAHTGQCILDNTFTTVTTSLGGTALTDGAISDVTGQVKITGTFTSTKAAYSGTVALTDAATIATDASLGNEFTVTLGGNRTMGVPTNAVDGQLVTYRIKQDGTGTRTLTWTTGSSGAFRFNTPFNTPVLQTAASAIDIFQFIYNATDARWDLLDVGQLNLASGIITSLTAGTLAVSTSLAMSGVLRYSVVSLTDAATIATDVSLGNLFTVTLGGNRTMGAPTNAGTGEVITYAIYQDGTGSRTLAWSSASGGFDFSSSPFGTPVINPAINSVSYITFVYDASITKWRPISPQPGNVSLLGTLTAASALTVSAGGAAIIGNSTVTGTLTATKAAYSGVAAITDGATINTDASLGNEFTVTIAGNRTIAAPTNATDGQVITYRIKQDGTGSRTLTWNSIFRFGSQFTSPILQTAASSIDYISFVYNNTDSKWDYISPYFGYTITQGSDYTTTASYVVPTNLTTGTLMTSTRYIVDLWMYISATAAGNNGLTAQVNFPASFTSASIMVDGYDSAGAALRQYYAPSDVGSTNPFTIGRDIGPIGTASVANNDWVHIQINVLVGATAGIVSFGVKTVGTGATVGANSNVQVRQSR